LTEPVRGFLVPRGYFTRQFPHAYWRAFNAEKTTHRFEELSFTPRSGAFCEALAQTMLEKDIGAIPIGENDRLVGMVTMEHPGCTIDIGVKSTDFAGTKGDYQPLEL
jgi:hypothetical protein